MLLQRILTAVPLAIGVIWLILFQPTNVFIYLLLLVSLVAGLEWCKLSGNTNAIVIAINAFIVMLVPLLYIILVIDVIEYLIY